MKISFHSGNSLPSSMASDFYSLPNLTFPYHSGIIPGTSQPTQLHWQLYIAASQLPTRYTQLYTRSRYTQPYTAANQPATRSCIQAAATHSKQAVTVGEGRKEEKKTLYFAGLAMQKRNQKSRLFRSTHPNINISSIFCHHSQINQFIGTYSSF